MRSLGVGLVELVIAIVVVMITGWDRMGMKIRCGGQIEYRA
jgi:hypothetical protein